ncbi:SIS domain-containing protein [Paenibacillus cymbidii]|uniref:SIS domain-containing protein n=1 Tax=Paenibacillus cymbidii TaxID=1639034 RepID=UPI001080352C|nr:SIS domain-containing protein [Paenibacillus cymbidii]
MSKTFGSLTHPEITAQPAALAKALEQLEAQRGWVDKYIGNSAFDEVIFIGSGSSYYQALTMAATFRKWLGRSASAQPSSEIFLFRDQTVARGRNVLLVGVSRSGESTEVILALESVKDVPGWTTCGITCHEDSKMAQIAECLLSPLGKELSTVMTKSLSSMTFLMQAAIAKASGDAKLQAELQEVVRMDEAVVAQADAAAQQLVNGNAEFANYIYLGMGAYYGLSLEASLKIKEMSYVWTEAYGTLEFRHGPKSIIQPGSLVCVIVSETARKYELKVAEEMQAYGAHVLLLTAEKGADTAFADTVVELGGKELSDEARSVLYLPLLQYVGYYTALKRNVDPDAPRNLTQVVKL